MRVLVTGGCGFIGSTLCRKLIARGDHVLNIDRLTYAARPASLAAIEGSNQYEFVRADIADSRAVADALARHRPSTVFHLAAESSVDRSISGPAVFIETNVAGTFHLLEAVNRYWAGLDAPEKQAFRFVHASTDEVYGSLGVEGSFNEETPIRPSSPYSATKAASDHLAFAWHQTFGLPVVVANSSNAYGPNQAPEKLIPAMIAKALSGRPLTIYGDGKNVRDWIFVEDAVDALTTLAARGKPGERYNVGARNEQTNLWIVGTICQILDEMKPRTGRHQDLMTFVADRAGHDRRYAVDPRKLERETGWRPKVEFSVGLRKTVEWYVENASWWFSPE